MIIKIDLSNIDLAVADSDKILISSDGEKALNTLLDVQEKIEAAIKSAKAIVKLKAVELNPNFSSVQGDTLKVSYRAYGARFKIDESYLDKLDATLYTKKVSFSPVAKEIEKYADEKGMPLGVIEVDREKQIVIQRKKK